MTTTTSRPESFPNPRTGSGEPPRACSGPLPPQEGGGHSPARPSASAVVAPGAEGHCTCFHAPEQHGGESCEAINFWGVACSCKATFSGLRAAYERVRFTRNCQNCGVRGFESPRCPECGALSVG
jgi:hypothetical protein